MKYMGSKSRIAKEIIPIMENFRTNSNQYWVEPFVGGANLIDKIKGNRIGSDIDKDCINSLIFIRDFLSNIPKNNNEFTEEDYKRLKKSSEDSLLKSFASYAYSYGGKKWGGWRRDKTGERDYVAEAYRNAVKQSPYLHNVPLFNKTFSHLKIPLNSIIYCDIPYKNTTKYSTYFDYNSFYQWCKAMRKVGHVVFLSEYQAPPEIFTCLWEKEIVSSLTKNTGNKKGIEKLFIVK